MKLVNAYSLLVLNLANLFTTLKSDRFSESSVKNFREEIRNIRDDILGVTKFQNHINDAVKLEQVKLDSKKIALQVSQSLSRTFTERRNAVKLLNDAVTSSFAEKNFGKWQKCCNMTNKFNDIKEYDSKFHSLVDADQMCDIVAPQATNIEQTPSQTFLEKAKLNMRTYPGIKWQYFGSDGGVLTRFPASPIPQCNSTYDNRYRPWYVQASTPKPKDVVIVLDRSGSMAHFGKMKAAIDAAVTVVSTLTPDDRMTVIAFSNEAYALGSESDHRNTSCFRHTMASATPMNKRTLVSMIQRIVPHAETYYGNALELAFKFLKESFVRDLDHHSTISGHTIDEISRSRNRVILFLSDGAPTDSPSKIFQLIRERNQEMRNSVVLLCFALGSGTFGAALQRMASQEFNFMSSDLGSADSAGIPSPIPGIYRHVVDVAHLRSAMGSYYSFFSSPLDVAYHDATPIVWSVPYYDAGGMGMVLTAASPVVVQGNLKGVVGVDITTHELFADVTYFRVAAHTSYAFLVDVTGRVLMHPSMPAPGAVGEDPVITGIEAFERTNSVLNFIHVTLHNILLGLGPEGEPAGSDDVFTGVFQTIRILPGEHMRSTEHNTTSSYSCSGVESTNFVFCVVVEANVTSVTNLGVQQKPPDFAFQYHRFDLERPSNMCRHQGQGVDMSHSCVSFAPSCFVDSGKYSELPETKQIVEDYRQYIMSGAYPSRDSPRFKPSVRSSLFATWALESIWLNSSYSSDVRSIADHVIWRYIGTEQGITRLFPGAEMPKLYNPVDRPWYELGHTLTTQNYIQSMKEGGKGLHESVLAAVSPPYVDAHGAGLVVTFSRGIIEPPPDRGDPNIPPHVFGVMGCDVYLSYIQQLVHQAAPECDGESSTCMLIDTSGYVIFDTRLMSQEQEALKLAVTSQYHVTHANADIASLLIRDGIMVQRKCVDVASITYKVGYVIDMKRLKKAVTSLPFDMVHLSGTNVIMLLVPNSFKLESNECYLHSASNANCLTYFPTNMSRCESPCTDLRASQHYQTCTNTYMYSWVVDPPPCIPLKFKVTGDDVELIVTTSELLKTPEKLQQIDVSVLPPCGHEVNDTFIMPETLRHIPEVNGLHLEEGMSPKQKFIVYCICCVLLLVAINLGLNKSKLKRILCSQPQTGGPHLRGMFREF